MENLEEDNTYNELNFLTQFMLSPEAILQAIRVEMDTLKECIIQTTYCEEEYRVILDRIMAISIRKLLLEEKTVLLQQYPDFKMPTLSDDDICTDVDDLHLIASPFSGIQNNLLIKDWQNQIIAYFDRGENCIPRTIPAETFQLVENKLNGRKFAGHGYLDLWRNSYLLVEARFHDETIKVYKRADECKKTDKAIHQLLDEIGYYKLTVYEFVKQFADRYAAHIEKSHMPFIDMINRTGQQGSEICLLSIQLLLALMQQIPEFSEFWPELQHTTGDA